MNKNLTLVFFSIFLSILFIEIFLRVIGLYTDLANITLEPSISIYEKPKNSFQRHKHPDLHYVNSNYFDLEGVKNKKKIITSKKKNIIGMFGDSMIENYAVNPEFDFSNILNTKIINYEVVNYGVGGYQAEQVFLRYIKYKDHDFKYVFYFFMPGDQESYGLLTFNDNGEYIINKIKINPVFKILGKLNITYLSINSFLNFRSLIYDEYTSIEKNNYAQLLANRIAKKQLKSEGKDIMHFSRLIEIFQKNVESNNAKFFVILYPDSDHINYFKDALKLRNLKVEYFILDEKLMTEKKFQFKNDSHWNELGNLEFAKNIEFFLNNNLQINFSNQNNYQVIEKKIANFYKSQKIK
jgi:hypothetical protein